MEDTLSYVKLSANATVPTRGTQNAAGYDLYSAYNYKIESGSRVKCKTDIAIKVPDGTYGNIVSRSGLAYKHGLVVITGTIDGDYTGNVFVCLMNTDPSPYHIKKGERIAQIIIQCIITPTLRQVSELPDTTRGAAGFGSTG